MNTSSSRRVITDEDLSGLDTWSSPRTLADLEFRRCSFYNCYVSPPPSPNDRVAIRNVVLLRCKAMNCDLYGAILEEVTVDGLTRLPPSPILLAACAFRHVTFRGALPSPRFVTMLPAHYGHPELQRPWAEANDRYYASIDWALDIRGARFGSAVEIRGVPSELVLHDPLDQIVVTRAPLLSTNWQKEDFGPWSYTLEWLLQSGAASIVVAAGRRDRRYHSDLEYFAKMRDFGLTSNTPPRGDA